MNNFSTSQSDGAHLGSIASIASPPPIQVQDAIIQRFYLQSLARELLPSERVAQCLRSIAPNASTVEIVHHPEKHFASYRNLLVCARLWHCPVCATRITELRAAELLKAVTNWTEQGGFVALLTFTVQHNLWHKLSETLPALRDSHRRFKSGAPFQRLSERANWHGSVSALEVTHTENGWHPHIHELVFFETLAAHAWTKFIPDAKARWLTVLAAEGRTATMENGLDIRDAETRIYDYVAKFGRLPADTKWTVERELAKSPVKKAREGGRSPFQLLIDFGNGDMAAGALFQEYARVFKGRNQLNWSRGLRSELGLGKEAADADLMLEAADEYVLLATLDRLQWRAVLALESDVRGELLAVAGSGDKQAVVTFLAGYGVYLEQG